LTNYKNKMRYLKYIFLILFVFHFRNCLLGEDPQVTYLLKGNVKSSEDSSTIDSMYIFRKIISDKSILSIGQPQDTIVFSNNGVYWVSFRAFIEPDEAQNNFDNTEMIFTIEKTNYKTIDTSFFGNQLLLEKYQRSSFKATLPDIYMVKEIE